MLYGPLTNHTANAKLHGGNTGTPRHSNGSVLGRLCSKVPVFVALSGLLISSATDWSNAYELSYFHRRERMKVRKLKDGDLIEVGDLIKVETDLGTRWDTVHRVSKKYAFVLYNEHAEGKYRRAYSDFGFRPIPRQTWLPNKYSAWRPIVPVIDGNA